MAKIPGDIPQAPAEAKITPSEADAPVSALAAAEIDNYARAMEGHTFVRELPASDE